MRLASEGQQRFGSEPAPRHRRAAYGSRDETRAMGRWGLQKRIMAYVAVGLFIGFAAFFFVGMRAVRRSTQFVFEERLAIAEKVAAELGNQIDHVIPDAEERLAGLTPQASKASLDDAADRARRHFIRVDRFAFFDVDSLWLVDATGTLLAEAPAGSYKASQVEDSPIRTISAATGAGVKEVMSCLGKAVEKNRKKTQA